MLFWFIAIAVTAIACAALYFAAAGRRVNAAGPDSRDSNTDFRQVLAGIDADLALGRLGEPEAQAAKAELAREVLRHGAEAKRQKAAGPQLGRGALLACIGLVAALALGSYSLLGSPAMPSQPLAGRADVAAANIDIDDALAKIEAQLAVRPDDVRGWSVIAPVYMQSGRYGDAERAYRHIIELAGPTADVQTSLAEALMLQAGEAGSPEAMQLLQAAAASDPAHVLSRLYIAAELTRTGRYDEAVAAWEALLAMAKGDEPWLTAVREGLLVAQNRGVPASGTGTTAAEAEMIAQMVQSLAGRLEADGGTVEEWTQLVRAYLVLGDTVLAQSAYDRAVEAYPRAFDRGELDTIALDGGLQLNGANP